MREHKRVCVCVGVCIWKVWFKCCTRESCKKDVVAFKRRHILEKRIRKSSIWKEYIDESDPIFSPNIFIPFTHRELATMHERASEEASSHSNSQKDYSFILPRDSYNKIYINGALRWMRLSSHDWLRSKVSDKSFSTLLRLVYILLKVIQPLYSTLSPPSERKRDEPFRIPFTTFVHNFSRLFQWALQKPQMRFERPV